MVSVTIEQPRVTKAMRVPMIQPTAKAKKKAMLSKKQIEILRLVNDGLANEEIAKAMCITEGTTKWHLHRIYSRLGVGSRTAAAAKARQLGII